MIRKGDILRFGDQTLMCGDCRDPAQVARLLSDVKPAIMFTSPPYLSQRVYAEAIGEWLPMMVQATLAPEMADDAQLFVNLGPCHKDGEWVPYWEPWLQAVRKHGWRRFQLCIWDKQIAVPGDFIGRMNPQYEFLFHLNKIGIKINKTVQCKHAGILPKRHISNDEKSGGRITSLRPKPVQKFRVMSNIISSRKQPPGIVPHPAVMGIGLAMQTLNAYARPNGTVYEPFCGSGTTLIAAHRLGLRGFGMEQSPEYCDIAAERIAKEMA
jgi:DNA modification methylase